MKESTGLLIWAWAGAIATVLQVIGLIRYVDRDLDDPVGVMLFGITAVLFAVTSVSAFVRWGRLGE